MGVMVAVLECAELASDAHPPPDDIWDVLQPIRAFEKRVLEGFSTG